jgi:hypothetical protein
MMITLKNTVIAISLIIIVLSGGKALGQLDDRFGAKGVEGTMYLGQKGLNWYRDWQDSYLPGNYPPPGKNKIWTVGKIDYRTDGLGMDYRWIILDLLEKTDVDFLQNFLNLCLAVVDSNIIPVIGDYWRKNKPLLETQLEDTLNNFTFTDKKLGIKYRAKCKNTNISFQEDLPDFILSVVTDTINFNTSLSADWTTHIYIEAWVLNPNPFNWGYHWKDIGDADCEFQTTINIYGKIGLEGQGRDRRLQIKKITPDSKTESDIDWSVFGISFSWEELSNAIEDQVDGEIETAIHKELNKEPITSPYYFVDFFKSLFSGDVVPTQQEILDRIWEAEKSHIIKVIKAEGYEGGYWSIGYEPNWFPLLKPKQYAEYYTKYYRLIKRLDLNAKVMGPSIFLTEAIENRGEVVWLFIPDIFKGILASIKEEFKNLVISYFEQTDTKTWYSEFINHLPPDVKVDVNDFHIFPMNADFQTMEWDSITHLMDEMAVFMRNVSSAENVWVSEFGNIDWRRSENDVADLCRNFCQYLKSNTVGIERWFWFLSHGHSPFYDIPFTPKPPITALLKNDFTLTQIGKAYLYEADCTPPIMESAPTDEGRYTSPGKIVFHWKEAKEYDTEVTDYQLQVKSEPGNITIFSEWIGNVLSHTITCYDGKTLSARVQAKNGAGLIGDWSGWSNGIIIRFPDSTDFEIVEGLEVEKMPDRKSLLGENYDNSQEVSPEIDNSERNGDLVGIESASVEVPISFELSQNYPNPFNSSTTINYQLPEDCHVLIKIYNAPGQEIKTLVDEYKAAAYYTVQWNGRDNNDNPVASGIYLYRIHAGNHNCIKKMVILQ